MGRHCQLGYNYFQVDKTKLTSCVPIMGRKLLFKFTTKNYTSFGMQVVPCSHCILYRSIHCF